MVFGGDAHIASFPWQHWLNAFGHHRFPLRGSRALSPNSASSKPWSVPVDSVAGGCQIRLGTDFCIEALEDALQRFGAPEIFNTDQGCQFTSEAFTGVLKAHGIAISMDGKGRWVDNVFVERLWRSLKYENIYLRAYETPTELRAGLARYLAFYNGERRHSALGRGTPDAVFFEQASVDLAA